MVSRTVEHKRAGDAGQILETLTPLALAIQVGEPNNERIVINASFLVERDRITEFDSAVDEIGRQQADRMRIKYTGPLPPHSFVQLRTGAQGGGAWSPVYCRLRPHRSGA